MRGSGAKHSKPATALVTVWTAGVGDVMRTPAAVEVLDHEETARTGQFRHAADLRRFQAARVLLRRALSNAVAGRIPPGAWRYRAGVNGKPVVAEGLPVLHFNLAHAGDCVAVAVCVTHPVGVDVECLEPDATSEVIYDVLTPTERRRIASLPPARRWSEFVRLWTVKEACTKALALGMDLEFSRVEASVNPPAIPAATVSAQGLVDVAVDAVERGGRLYQVSAAVLRPTAREARFSFAASAV